MRDLSLGSPRPHRDVVGIARFAAYGLLVLAASGCGLRAQQDHVDPPVQAIETVARGNDDQVADQGPEPVARAESLVEQGRALVVEGRYEEALSHLEMYLVFGEDEEYRRQAAWSLALALLVPESPVRNRARAIELLEYISEEYSGTLEALQSVWIREVLADETRRLTGIEERDRTIRELNELVEQLKRIDLNRRPPGGTPEPLPRRR